MEELIALLGLGGGGMMVGDAYDKLGDIGDDAWTRSQAIGDQSAGIADFQGYGVTGPTGTTNVDAIGNVNMQLNQRDQEYANYLQNQSQHAANPDNVGNQFGNTSYGAAQGMIPGLTGSSSGREQEIYDRIRAMQRPDEIRQNTALGSQLAAQGRTGLRTGQYGGSPEQLALDKARAEGMNSASYEAINLARQQQEQQANIFGMLGQQGTQATSNQGQLANQYGLLQYAPQGAMLDQFGAGTNAYQYEDVARRQAANLQAEAQMGGLEGQLGAGLGQANLMGNIGSSLIGGSMGMFGNMIESGGEFFGGLFGGS